MPQNELIDKIFLKASKNCSAYKSFLKENNFIFESTNDYHLIPIMDKNNYLNKFQLEEKLYTDKKLSDYYMVCSSTGSTGEATIWPREYSADEKAVIYQEKFLDEHFQISKKKTLIVVMFGLGLSTSGMLTAKLSWENTKNKSISVITPGVDLEGAVKLINKIYSHYEQTVIIGYPPLVKDFIEIAVSSDVDIKKWNIKLSLTGENVSIFWKNKVLSAICDDHDFNRIMMFYACSEAGILGVETIKTKYILQKCLENRVLLNDLFFTDAMPTLIAVEQKRVFIEVVNDEILISVDQPVPLIRYNLHDKGMLVTGYEIKKVMLKHELDLSVDENDVYLCIYGRNQRKQPNDITLTIEEIKNVLEQPAYEQYLTGFFNYGENDQTIDINIVIKENISISKDLIGKINKQIVLEFKNLIKNKKSKEIIDINLSFSQGKNCYRNGKLPYYNS